MTGNVPLGQVGVEWQVAGFGDFIRAPAKPTC